MLLTLRTIEQMKEFLNACGPVAFTAAGEDGERYGHISRVLLRFDYPGRNKRERGVVLRYLQHTSGYSRAQMTRFALAGQPASARPPGQTLRSTRPALCAQIHPGRRGTAGGDGQGS